MLPYLQLDDQTFSLLVNQSLVSKPPTKFPLGDLIPLAYGHVYDVLNEKISMLDGDHTDIAIRMSSEVWHEKRHFLDLILTNYGMALWRTGASYDANASVILKNLKELKDAQVAVPLSSYFSSISRRQLAISYPDKLEPLMANLRSAQEAAAIDNSVLQGGIRVGGRAQLEAIAYICQLRCSREAFGWETSVAAFNKFDYFNSAIDTHLWPISLFEALELSHLTDQINRYNPVFSLGHLTICILYYALNGPFRSLKNPGGQSILPADRLYSILDWYSKTYRDRKDVPDTEESWDLVNKFSTQMAGHNLVTEIESDIEHYRNVLKQSSRLSTLYEDIVDLRGELLGTLQRNPEQIIDPAAYEETIAPALLPYIVSCLPDGHDGSLSDDLSIVTSGGLGDSRPKHIIAQRLGTHTGLPESELQVIQNLGAWVWMAAPTEWPPSKLGDGFCLKRTSEWRDQLGVYAPVGSLLRAGFAETMMVGASQLEARDLIEGATGLNVVVEDGFNFPNDSISSYDLSLITGAEHFICDFTNRKIDVEAAEVISRWKFEVKQTHKEALIDYFASTYTKQGLSDSGAIILAVRTVEKSWSPWVVDKSFGWSDSIDEFRARLDNALDAWSPLDPPSENTQSPSPERTVVPKSAEKVSSLRPVIILGLLVLVALLVAWIV